MHSFHSIRCLKFSEFSKTIFKTVIIILTQYITETKHTRIFILILDVIQFES